MLILELEAKLRSCYSFSHWVLIRIVGILLVTRGQVTLGRGIVVIASIEAYRQTYRAHGAYGAYGAKGAKGAEGAKGATVSDGLSDRSVVQSHQVTNIKENK